jgi:hypothetical protein
MTLFKRKKPFKIRLDEIPRYRELYKLYKGLRKKQIAKVIETNITYERLERKAAKIKEALKNYNSSFYDLRIFNDIT